MKIGILTLRLHNNYGGILQAYALQKVLQQMGHDATLIDKSRFIKLPFFKKYPSYFKRLIKNVLFDSNLVVRWDKKYNDDMDVISINTYPFILKHIKRIEANNNYSNIKQDDFDAFVEKAYSGIPDRTSTIQEKEAAIKAKKAIMQHPKCPSSTKPELQREIQIIQAEIDGIKAGPSIFMQE